MNEIKVVDSIVETVSTAHGHLNRFYRNLDRSHHYGPSILERFRRSRSEKEIHDNLLRALAEVPASASTKRKWKKAAEQRLGELRAATIVRAA
jgi:hypothetical protein